VLSEAGAEKLKMIGTAGGSRAESASARDLRRGLQASLEPEQGERENRGNAEHDYACHVPLSLGGRLQFRELEEGMAFELRVNGTLHTVDADPQTPLLWVIRDHVGLTGTKFSCGIGQCGACTLHVDGRAIRSCSVPAATAIGKPVVTIEGVSPDGSHPIQIAWKEFDTPQCGYCQSGMIMSALALLRQRPTPSDADIDAQVTNACRCGTYHRVRQAIHLAADLMKNGRKA
jgi:isoquinoline 1-oxidoreductase subunit alpha